jgi:hypothetical protein
MQGEIHHERNPFPPSIFAGGTDGTFRSVRNLIQTVHDYIRLYKQEPTTVSVGNASRIIRKVNRYKGISETGDKEDQV